MAYSLANGHSVPNTTYEANPFRNEFQVIPFRNLKDFECLFGNFLYQCVKRGRGRIGCLRIIQHVFFHNYRYCAGNAEGVDTKILRNTHQKAKLKATQFRSPLMTLFSHYFRLALRSCFSLCVQLPNRQLLTRGAIPDSTTERLT